MARRNKTYYGEFWTKNKKVEEKLNVMKRRVLLKKI